MTTTVQPGEPTRTQLGDSPARYLLATRPPFLLATIVPVLLGLALVQAHGVSLHWGHALLSLVAAALLHAGVNVLNDYYDARNGTDAINRERLFPFTGGSRMIQNGVLSEREMGMYGAGLMLAVLAIGLYLVTAAGALLFWLGLAGVVLGWAYSAPPLSLNSRGLGELTVMLGFALLPAGAYAVQAQSVPLTVWLASVPSGLLIANLLYINQFPDRAADRAVGKHHWVARLQPQTARWGYLLLAVLAYGWLLGLVLAGLLPVTALLGLLPIFASFSAAGQLIRNAEKPQHLAPAIKLTILAALVHGLLLSAGLLVG